MGKSRGGHYAVARGRSVGVYQTWDECKSQVDGFTNARYKKFESNEAAMDFIRQEGGSSSSSFGSGESDHQPTYSVGHSTRQTTGASSTAEPAASRTYGFARSYTKPSANIGYIGLSSNLQTLPATIVSSSLENTSRYLSTTAARSISTTAPAEKRRIAAVTNDRVVNKRSRLDNDNTGIDLSKYEVDDNGYVVVYTDGACSKNGSASARAGVGVWFGDDNQLNISEPVRGRATNNTAEIQAAERAISQAKSQGITKLNVQTDSQFLIRCATEWMNKWQRNGWKLTGGKPVINRDDLEKLNSAATDMNIKWSYVPGHKGHRGNEAADRLAVEGASKYK